MNERYIDRCTKLARTVKYLYSLRDIDWAKHLVSLEVQPQGSRFSVKSRELCIEEFNLCLSRGKHSFFLAGLHLAKTLRYVAGANFHIDDNSRLLCHVKGVTVVIQSLEDIWILHEIFVIGVYSMVDSMAAMKPMVVWDIGMNIGLASLYFATKDDVIVVGYEPFMKTYRLALRNFMLNPDISKKIAAFNYGIGGSDRIEKVEYCSEYKGSVGIRGLVGDAELRRVILGIDEKSVNFTKEDLVMKNASEILESILSEYPGMSLVAKIDCEGAEYEIIDSLYHSGKLSAIDAIMMEWHRDGPDQLTERLMDAGFSVSSFGRADVAGQGMIYAVRSQSPIAPSAGRPMAWVCGEH